MFHRNGDLIVFHVEVTVSEDWNLGVDDEAVSLWLQKESKRHHSNYGFSGRSGDQVLIH